MIVSYPPFYPQQILDADGKPVAGGRILSFYAGTDVPLAMFAPDGTSLGSSVSIASDGTAVFCLKVGTPYKLVCVDADGATIWTRDKVKVSAGDGMVNPMEAPGDLIVGGPDGDPLRLAPGADGDALKIVGGVPTWTTDQTGMANPMTTKGDLIVGYTDGEPDRLGVGNDGDILGSWLFGGSVQPKWEAGPKKYRNVYHNIPSPDIDDGYLGCLFYMTGGGAQTIDLPSAASIPSKSFIDFVFLDDTTTLTITPHGGSVLNTQATAVTVGGKSATLYRLTFLGHGGSGDEWALGGSGNGDHKTAVDGADASPDYLAAKLAAGSGISLTNTGSAVEIAATAQTGDHQLLVSATDAAAGYLGAKLTAGSNVTLTPHTDPDTGAQTLELSATGGGGGGGSDWSYLSNFSNHYVQSSNTYFQLYFSFNPLGPTVRSILIPYGDYAPNKAVNVKIAIWKVSSLNSPSLGTPYAEKSFSGVSVKQPLTWFDFDADVDVSDKTKCYVFAFSTTTTNTGFNPRLLLSDSGGASYNFMFASYQMKANDAWVSSYPAFVSGNNTNAFGLSSRAMNS